MSDGTDEEREQRLIKRRARRAAKAEHYRVAARALYAKDLVKSRANNKRMYDNNVEARRASRRAYHARNPANGRELGRAWRRANPERARELNRRWNRANPEKVRAMSRAYREANPDKLRAALMRYRYKACKAAGHATDEQIKARVEFFGGVCSYCGGPYEHLDHAISVSRGGTNWPANLRPACERCNLSKGAKSAFEFIAWRLATRRS